MSTMRWHTRRGARFGLLLLLALPPRATTGAEGSAAGQDAALRAAMVPLRTLDTFEDDDFADLLPLRARIGEARVVQLGEATHGDGAAIAAKARLVRFLHQSMGFDVIAFESGIFDVTLLDAALDDAGVTIADAARRGLYAMWADNRDVQALLEYVRATRASSRSIALAGIDARLATEAVRSHAFADHVLAALDLVDPHATSPADREHLRALCRAAVPADHYARPGPRGHDRAAITRMLQLLAQRRAEFEQALGADQTSFLMRALESTRDLDAWLATIGTQQRAARGNRDRLMADNLLWLVRSRHPTRKVVVWAHNYHVMEEIYTRTTPAQRAATAHSDIGPMGRFVARALGDAVFTVGSTAYSGAHGVPGEVPIAIAPKAEGDLESALHRTGHARALLAFRDLDASHALAGPCAASFYFHEPVVSAWNRVFDAVLFIDAMTPSR